MPGGTLGRNPEATVLATRNAPLATAVAESWHPLRHSFSARLVSSLAQVMWQLHPRKGAPATRQIQRFVRRAVRGTCIQRARSDLCWMDVTDR